MAKCLNDAGSPSTVYRALRFDLEYKPLQIKKRVKLTESHKEHRLDNAKFQHKNHVKIEDVAFSDEKQFLLNPKPGHHDYV